MSVSILPRCGIYSALKGKDLLFLISPLADDHADRRPLESKGLPQMVFNVPLIGKMKELCIVAKQNKSGRGY